MSSILINEISNDFIKSYERTEELLISGYTSDIPDNETILIELNNKIYETKVLGNTFNLTVSPDDILDLEDDTQYTITATWNEISDTEDVSTGEFKLGIQEIHSVNVVTTSQRRFVSDEEMENINSRITELEQRTFQQDTPPDTGVNDSDIWLDTSTNTLKVYREHPLGSGNYRWEPLIYKWYDNVDGGTW